MSQSPWRLGRYSGLVDLHLPKLLLPSVEAHLGEVVLPAYLHDALGGVRLPQYPDLVLCTVSLSFHGLWGWLNPKTNTPSGSNLRGHVSRE